MNLFFIQQKNIARLTSYVLMVVICAFVTTTNVYAQSDIWYGDSNSGDDIWYGDSNAGTDIWYGDSNAGNDIWYGDSNSGDDIWYGDSNAGTDIWYGDSNAGNDIWYGDSNSGDDIWYGDSSPHSTSGLGGTSSGLEGTSSQSPRINYTNPRYSYGGGNYYSNFGGYTSSYTYGGGRSYNPTWSPNIANWSTDYTLPYSTQESAPSNSNGSASNPNWNPDMDGWNTDYQLTYATNNSRDYRVTCIVDDTTVERSDEVEFTAKVTGGKGDYEYEWYGDDDVDSSKKTFEHEFDDNGIYRVSVEVTDEDGYTTYDDCDAVFVGRDYYSVNYVQDYGNNEGDLASANSVYLSQVPYTGVEDTAKVAGFVAVLIIWSAAVGYYLIKRKQKNTISNRIADFKKANLAARA